MLNLCQGGAGAGVYYSGKEIEINNTPRDYYGAIAADVVTGQTSCSSNNYTSAVAAKSTAIQKCGLPGCKVIIAYKNGCGTTAAARTPIGSPNHVVGGIGDSPEAAEANAMSNSTQVSNA